MEELPIQAIKMGKISCKTLKMQRMSSGLSQRDFAALIRAATGKDEIIFNGSNVACSRGTIERMEDFRKYEDFYTDYATALIMQKILSKKRGIFMNCKID